MLEKGNMMGNQNFQNTSRLGFWITTTLVIIVTVFLFIFLGAFNVGGYIGNLWLTVGLALISGSCVALLHALIPPFPSVQARVKWFGITTVSITIGWCIVFVLWNFLNRLQFSSTFSSDQLGLAVIDAFVTGAVRGAIVGLVTGLIQGSIQHLSMRSLFVGNLISWSIGVGISFAAFVVFILQIKLF